MNNSRQWTEGMSRERFWQEAALRFMDQAVMALMASDASRESPEKLAQFAPLIAKASFIFADAMAKQHGPDDVPRGNALPAAGGCWGID